MSLRTLAGSLTLSIVIAVAIGLFTKGGKRPDAAPISLRHCSRLSECCLFGFIFGISLAISGWSIMAGLTTILFSAALVGASNAKYAVLHEPLVFTDFVLLKNVFRHPEFYSFAVGEKFRIALIGGLLLTGALLVEALFRAPASSHVMGLIIAAVFCAMSWGLPVARLAPEPDLAKDIIRLGLGGCLFVYWRRWIEQSRDPLPRLGIIPAALRDEIRIIVQCESFAEPDQLGLSSDRALPQLHELERARVEATQSGQLSVGVFGAYTLRTEYAVMSGYSEERLSFRRFDPFLTALKNADTTLASLVSQAGFHSIYVHPHDLDFADRSFYMPRLGFNEVIGAEGFPPHAPERGGRVTDEALTRRILEILATHSGPVFIYAVTIENHGPWSAHGDPIDNYLANLSKSDAMIGTLTRGIKASGRPARIIFFGDHRPSIVGVTSPVEGLETPYIIMDFNKESTASKKQAGPVTIPPEALFHAALEG